MSGLSTPYDANDLQYMPYTCARKLDETPLHPTLTLRERPFNTSGGGVGAVLENLVVG